MKITAVYVESGVIKALSVKMSDVSVNKVLYCWVFYVLVKCLYFVFSTRRKAWYECTVDGNRDKRAMLEITRNILVTTHTTWIGGPFKNLR